MTSLGHMGCSSREILEKTHRATIGILVLAQQ